MEDHAFHALKKRAKLQEKAKMSKKINLHFNKCIGVCFLKKITQKCSLLDLLKNQAKLKSKTYKMDSAKIVIDNY